MLSERNRVASTLSSVLVLSLITSLGFFTIQDFNQIGSADPVLIPNGNYTSTVMWDFQDASNYTTANVDLTNQEAKLIKVNSSWEQTTGSDFNNGTFDNSIATLDGRVVLSNLTKNVIANGDFSSDSDWTFQNSSKGNISSEWSATGQNAWIHHNSPWNPPYFGSAEVALVVGDGRTEPPGLNETDVLRSDDQQYYHVRPGEYVLVVGFDASSIQGKVERVVLWAQYRVEDKFYDSQTSLMCKNESGVFQRTDVIPMNQEMVDANKSSDITSFYSSWNQTVFSSLEVRFDNTDSAPFAYVDFNRIWLEIYIAPIDETAYVYQGFARGEKVGYKDTRELDFLFARNRTNLELLFEPGNVTLAFTGGRKTKTIWSDLISGKDSYIASGPDSGNNYGGTNTLEMLSIVQEKRILIEFNLSAIPTDASVEKAVLWLQMSLNTGPDENVTFYRITQQWGEMLVTWDNPWLTGGGDYDPAPLSTKLIKYSYGDSVLVGWDMTSNVDDWHTLTYANYGMIGIVSEIDTFPNERHFHSRETGFSPFAPRLEVTYSNKTYASLGNLESRILDAERNVTWKNISWTQSVIPGTTDLRVYTRTGWMPDPYINPEAWGNWTPGSAYQNPNGEPIQSSPNRYLQYKVEFFTSDQNYSPVLSDIMVRWSDVKLNFDYRMENVISMNKATLVACIDGEEVWSADLATMMSWASEEVEISSVLVDELMHTVRLGLSLYSNISGATNGTARFDNVRITNPLYGEYSSPVHSAGLRTKWENISWVETVTPGTNVEIRTRVGNTSIPDSNWTGWSPPYTVSSGEDVGQPPTPFIQYKIVLSSTDPDITPEVESVRIEYSNFYDWGMLKTFNFSPVGILEWGIFNASANIPNGTDIKYFYSTNNGTSWFEMSPGFNMSSVAIPDIQIKAELFTSSNESTPVLYEMSLTFIHLEPLASIEMSISWWNGTADDTLNINALGRDMYGKTVTFEQYWSTTDPNGTVDSMGLYTPGSAGIWRVYCNNSDNSISNYTTVTVSPGLIVQIGIDPWNPGVVTADDNITFGAYGCDSDGNRISQATVNWSLTDIIGTLDPGPSFSAFFDATTTGTGRVIADDGRGNINVTSVITVVPGATADVAITPWDPGTITADDTILFTAYGKDSDGNAKGNVSVSWSVVGGVGDIPPGPNSSALFDATRIGNGRIVADDGLGHVNSTNLFSVLAGEISTIEITPSYAEVGTGEEQNFTAQGFDADGNQATLVTTIWTTNVGNIVQATATSATLVAQDTDYIGGWVEATHGSAVGSATVNVTENLLAPVINGTIPSQERPEDYGSWSLDLSGFADDPNEDLDTLMWNLKNYDSGLYTVTGTNIAGNHVLVFSTVLNANGNDLAELELMNSLGLVDSQMIWINITSVNDDPIISGAPDLFVRYDEPYDFDYSPYVWDIDNDTADLSLTTDDPTNTTAQGLNVTFSYPQSMVGHTAFVRITVWDGAGGWDSDIVAVRISSNYPPTLVGLLPDIRINESETKEDVFDLDDYIVDPDMDSLFFSFGYTHLTITIDDENNVSITAEQNWIGWENVTFRAVDPNGGIAEDTITVEVVAVNDPPEISGVPPLVIHFEYPYTFDLTPYILDVDNDTSELTISTNNPDNVTVNGLKITLLYPEYWGGNPYPYSVQLTIFVSDGLDSSFQVITVTVNDNYPPEILTHLPDLTFEEDFQYQYAFDLDGYFNDTDSDTLFFVSGQEILIVTIHENHTVSFEAPLDWYGVENVTFRAIDSEGAIVEDTIRVEVIPVNDPPVVLTIPNQFVGERQWTLDITAYISDVDNDISELNITTNSQYVTVESMILFFDYPEGVSEENITIRVSDGISNTTRSILVVIIGNEPTDWLSENWLMVLILILTIMALIGSAGYLLLRKALVIEDIFLIHNNGMLLEHHTRRLKLTVDHDILSGMLTAILEFAKETFTYGEGGGLRKMDIGERIILLERGRFVTVAVVVRGEEPEDMTERMAELVEDIEEKYPDVEKWDGKVGAYKDLPEMLGRFSKGTYEKGFWKTGQKKIRSLLDRNQKNNNSKNNSSKRKKD
ncbi:MAG: DNRLRE domain-containing protein [Methanomassiliicoccales archaeon]|nr:MAG: DNRLRE domain-containing protein [Methanomassiliicoccales archaeon]